MALELVKLDSTTLPGIADAIRTKTGETALLLPSQMAAAIGGIKNLRVETGTITPAEDVTSLAIPCSDVAKAFVLVADSTVIGAVEGQASKRYVTTAVANFVGSIDGAPNTAMQVWNLSSYANAGRVSTNTDGVDLSSSYYFYPGTYRWTAYYWEDNA